jgi:hypothetical protein
MAMPHRNGDEKGKTGTRRENQPIVVIDANGNDLAGLIGRNDQAAIILRQPPGEPGRRRHPRRRPCIIVRHSTLHAHISNRQSWRIAPKIRR